MIKNWIMRLQTTVVWLKDLIKNSMEFKNSLFKDGLDCTVELIELLGQLVITSTLI
jgi:hypothetical protein